MAYVLSSQHQLVQAMVLFFLPLDEKGYCLDGWRLPLQRLADTAGRGPNLGAGRIRLACYTQCSISWHKDSLWDPLTSTFSQVKKALQENFQHLASTKVAEEESDNPLNQKSGLEGLRRELRNESATYRNQLQVLQQEVERQCHLNERLSSRLDESPVQASSPEQRVDLQVLRHQNDQLEMKVRELQNSNEQLRQSQQSSVDDSENNIELLIKKMSDNDILSVVFQPGAGHINLTPHQLVDYLDDPVAFTAHYVHLSKSQYQDWLGHQEKTKCAVCDVQIPLIADPAIFDSAVDIYCDQHKP